MNRPTLSSLLDQRTLRRGEAVTVLVSLLQTLDDLHGLECTHGLVSADYVVFDASGRPTFDEWQYCVEHRQGDALAPSFRPAMLDDCRAFAELARQVLTRTQPPMEQVQSFLQMPLDRVSRGRREPFARECEAELFALGEAEAIDLPRPSEPLVPPLVPPLSPGGSIGLGVPLVGGDPPLAGRAALDTYDWGAQTSGALATIAADVVEWERSDREAARPRARVRALAARGLFAAKRWRTARTAPDDDRYAPGTPQRRARGSGRRTRRVRLFAVAAVVCVSAVGGALFAVPAGGQATGGGQATAPPPAVAGGSAAPGGSAARGGSVAARGGFTADDEATVAAEDPVAAGAVLLRLREQCLQTASEECLLGVDQVSSTAFDDDRAAIRETHAAGAATKSRGAWASLRLVQAMGATALLEVTAGETTGASGSRPGSGAGGQREPASLLLVKGEAGWRIRAVFDSG